MPPKKITVGKSAASVAHEETFTNYREEYRSNLKKLGIRESEASDEIKSKFLLENTDSKARLIEFLYLLKTIVKTFKQDYFSQFVIGKINSLIITATPESSVEEATLVLEVFAGFEKHQLQDLEIKGLVRIFNEAEIVSPCQICDFLKACAKISYHKDELEIDLPKLVGDINLQFVDFGIGQKVTLLNSLARLGYDYGSEELTNILDKISQSIKKEIWYVPFAHEKALSVTLDKSRVTFPYPREIKDKEIDSEQFSSLIHSLVKLEMFNDIFSQRDHEESWCNQVNNFFTPEKISQLSSDSAFSLLQAHMQCSLLHRSELFNKSVLDLISDRFTPLQPEISNLQRKVEEALIDKGYEVTEEYPVFKINDKEIRCVDLRLRTVKDGSSIEYFIEVDGPTHFLLAPNELGELTPDSRTKKRDLLNKTAIKLLTISQSKYITLSFKEIEEQGENLAQFVFKKIRDEKEIDVNIEESQKSSEDVGKLDSSFATATPEISAVSTKAAIKLQEVSPKKSKIKSAAATTSKTKNTEISLPNSTKATDKTLSDFWNAILQGRVKDVEDQIRKGVDLNATQNGLDPFSFAIDSAKKSDFSSMTSTNYIEIYRALVSAGADVSKYREVSNEVAKAEATNKKKKAKTKENDLELIAYELISNPDLAKKYKTLFCALIKLDSVRLNSDKTCNVIKSGSAEIVEAWFNKSEFEASVLNKTANRLAVSSLLKKIKETSIITIEEAKVLDIIFNQPEVDRSLFEIDNNKLIGNIIRSSSRAGCSKTFSDFYLERLKNNDEILSITFESVKNRWINILEFFFPEGNYEELSSLMLEAIIQNQEEVINFAISRGANINYVDPKIQIGALALATENNNESLVKFLLKKEGIDVNVESYRASTPFIIACNSGFTEIAKILLDNGANINSKAKIYDESGIFLHYASGLTAAASDNNQDTLEFLLKLEKDGKKLITVEAIKETLEIFNLDNNLGRLYAQSSEDAEKMKKILQAALEERYAEESKSPSRKVLDSIAEKLDNNELVKDLGDSK